MMSDQIISQQESICEHGIGAYIIFHVYNKD